jgi:CDP-glucose 4,6-dehydratase
VEDLDVSAFWTGRPVLVTGATGFLGSHLTGMLRALGSDVVVLVRDDVPPTPVSAAWRGQVAEVAGDVREQELLERVLGEYRVATVFHLAAQTQVGVANRNAVSTFESNVRGTWSLLEACRRSPKIEQVVVASSDKAYGDQPRLPYTEDMPLRPVHPYDVSKACSDLLGVSYHATFDVPVCITRCGNFFGPGDVNWERLVPSALRSLLRGERPVVRSDGTPTRDYLYVEDGALAYLRTAEAMAERPELIGEAFNFSTESPLSVLEVVDLLRAATGRTDLEADVQVTATGEIAHQYLSAEKARRLLDWKPRHDLRDALDRTVEWYRGYLAATP